MCVVSVIYKRCRFLYKINRLVNSRYFQEVQKTRTRDFEQNKVFLSKFPCQPSLPTLGSLSFPRIPTLALAYKINKTTFIKKAFRKIIPSSVHVDFIMLLFG